MKQLNDVFHTSKKELAETKGDSNEYLGLAIDFSGRDNPKNPDKKRQLVFTMYDYIKDIIDSTPPDMHRISPDPEKFKLLTVHKTSP